MFILWNNRNRAFKFSPDSLNFLRHYELLTGILNNIVYSDFL